MNPNTIEFPRFWVETACKQMDTMKLPDGPAGDWMFLFREQLKDALNRSVEKTAEVIEASAHEVYDLMETIFPKLQELNPLHNDLHMKAFMQLQEYAENILKAGYRKYDENKLS